MSIAKKSVKWLVAAILVFALVITAVIAVGNVATAQADEPLTAKVIVVASSDTGSYPYFPTGVDHTITVKYYFEIPTVENETKYQLTVAPTLNYAGSEPEADVLRPASITFNTAKFTISKVTGADTYLEGYIQENNPDYDENDPDPTAPSSSITIAFGAKPTSGVTNDAISDADNYLFEATFEIDELANPGQYDLGLTRADSVFAAGYSPKGGVNYTYDFYEISGADETETSFYLNTAIAVPTAVEGLVYNGTLQTGVPSGTGYTIVDNEEYDAGNYEATATLSAGYIWVINNAYTAAPQTIEWSIAKANATISVDAGSATYNEPISAPAISYSGFYDMDADLLEAAVTGLPSQGDNVGIYPISVSYEPDDNYIITVYGNNFTITPVVVAVPSGESLTYNGSEQTGVAAVNNAPYVLTGTTAATNVGQYSATASLNHVGDIYNYVWEGYTGADATSDKTINWSISPAIIEVPQAVTGLVYTGSEQTGVADPGENGHYTITDNKATNAGNYTASVTPAANYAFYINEQYVTAAQTVAWSIAPKAASISVANASSAYNDSENFAIPSISYSGFITTADETNLGATIVTTVAYNSNVGDYSMTIYYTDNSNYDISVTNGTYTITAAKIAKPSVTNEFVYNGELRVAVSAGTGYTLSGTYEATNANQYQATATLDSNYAWNDDSTAPYVINWVINKASNVVEFTTASADIPYKATAVTASHASAETATDFIYTTTTGEVGTVTWRFWNAGAAAWDDLDGAPTEVGYYQIQVRVAESANYQEGFAQHNFLIVRATIPVPTAVTGLVYNGSTKTGVEAGTGYLLTGNTAINAGDYTATATLDGNHAWEGYTGVDATSNMTINWSIAKAANNITISGPSSIVYGNAVTIGTSGTTFTYTATSTAGLTINWFVGENDNWDPLADAPTNVGNYKVEVYAGPSQNYLAGLEDKEFSITRAQIAVPTANTGLVYNGSTKTGVETGTGYSLTGNTAINAGDYTATATLDGNHAWVGGSTADAVIAWSIAKADQTVTIAWDPTKVTFDQLTPNEASRQYNGNAVAIGTEFTVTAQSDGAKSIVAANSDEVLTITSVGGPYAFRVRVAGNTNYNDGYTGVYTIEIKPADVKVYLVAKMGTSTVYLQYAAGAYTEVQEPTVSTITMGQSLPAAPAYRYLYTQGFSDGNAIVTGALAYTDQINTYTATYQVNVGIGDMNGDGRIGATDLIVIQRLAAGMIGSARKINLVYPSDPEDAEAYQSGVVDKIWVRRNDTSESFNYTFSNVADIDGNGFSSSDIVAMREALATGYTYKIITNFQEGNVTGQFVGSVARQTVTTYQQLVDKVMSGYPVLLGNDITDMSKDIFADVEDFRVMGTTIKVYNVNVDIDLGGYTLRVNSFNLNNTAAEAILKVANGNIFTVDGINITAPNGNIILTDVNGYNYEGKTVNLAAASSSLHMDGEVGFYLYKIKDLDVDSAKTAIAGGTGIEDYVDEDQTQVETYTFDQIVTNRISTTDTKIAAAKVIKESTDYVDETERAEALDAINVKKSPITVPVRTHVVVEEQANLVVENIKVVAVSEEDTTSATFSIEVKNADAEVLTVDVSKALTAVSNVYVVNEITVGGEGTVEVVKGDNTSVTEVAYVASIGSTNYETFDAAATAVEEGGTVKLLRDVSYGTDHPVTVWAKAFDVDLNGKTFTTMSEVSITQGNGGYKATALCFEPNHVAPSITIYNGKIVTAYGAGVYPSGNKTIMTLKDLNVTAATVGTQTQPEYSAAVRLGEGPIVTIESGSYSGTKAVVVTNSGGTLTINGGTFNGAVYFAPGTDSGVTKSITINGGTFNNVAFENTNKGTLKIYGGTFDADPTTYVPAGYGITENDGTYTVAALTGVACVGHVAYESFDAAVAAVPAGGTVTLLENITFGTDRSVPVWSKAFNIDLNGKTFTTNSTETITLSDGGCYASALCYSLGNSPVSVNIYNGNIVTAYGAGVYVDDPGITATLSGLNIHAGKVGTQSTEEYTTAVRVSCNATINIESGTYRGAKAVAVACSGGVINISGGTFYGELFINTAAGKTQIINITGGTFDHDPTAYVNTEAYDVTFSNGMYTVTAKA